MKTQFRPFVQHVAMVWKENRRTEAWLEPWSWEGTREDEEVFQRLTLAQNLLEEVLKERNPWLTPTESCASDETEVEDAKPFGPLACWTVCPKE